MISRKKILFVLGIFVLSVLVPSGALLAKKTIGDADSTLSGVVAQTGVDKKDIPTVMGEVIQMGLLIVGLAFFALSVYAGMRWLTSRGNEEAVTKARSTLIAAVIGLIIIVSAYAFTTVFTTRLISGGGGITPPADSLGDGTTIKGCCLHIFKNKDKDALTANFPYWVIGGMGVTKEECEVIQGASDDAVSGKEGEAWEYHEGLNSEQCQEQFELK